MPLLGFLFLFCLLWFVSSFLSFSKSKCPYRESKKDHFCSIFASSSANSLFAMVFGLGAVGVRPAVPITSPGSGWTLAHKSARSTKCAETLKASCTASVETPGPKQPHCGYSFLVPCSRWTHGIPWRRPSYPVVLPWGSGSSGRFRD